MTTISEPNRADLGVSKTLPPVAQGLKSAFVASDEKLCALATALSDGRRIRLTQRSVHLAPYIGPSAEHMRALRYMASTGNDAAARELRIIADFHTPSRYNPLVKFLNQFPVAARQLLLGAVRDDLTELELEAGADNKIVQVITRNASTLHEYGLRAFRLSFVQACEVAAWIRQNEGLLPTMTAKMPPARKNDDKITAARYATLTAFFDNLPEKMRDLLVAKARQELTSIRFEVLPTGEVVLRVNGGE